MQIILNCEADTKSSEVTWGTSCELICDKSTQTCRISCRGIREGSVIEQSETLLPRCLMNSAVTHWCNSFIIWVRLKHRHRDDERFGKRFQFKNHSADKSELKQHGMGMFWEWGRVHWIWVAELCETGRQCSWGDNTLFSRLQWKRKRLNRSLLDMGRAMMIAARKAVSNLWATLVMQPASSGTGFAIQVVKPKARRMRRFTVHDLMWISYDSSSVVFTYISLQRKGAESLILEQRKVYSFVAVREMSTEYYRTRWRQWWNQRMYNGFKWGKTKERFGRVWYLRIRTHTRQATVTLDEADIGRSTSENGAQTSNGDVLNYPQFEQFEQDIHENI